jgi:hypothetical protein
MALVLQRFGPPPDPSQITDGIVSDVAAALYNELNPGGPYCLLKPLPVMRAFITH